MNNDRSSDSSNPADHTPSPTSRKAKQTTENAEERFRTLFENANDIIFTCDLLGNFTSFNRAGEKLTGYSCEEVLSMNFAEVVAPESLDTAKEMLARKTFEDIATVYEIEIVTRDGRRVPVEISSRTLSLRDRPIGVQGVARDMTERNQAEAQLRHQLDFTKAITNSLGEGVYALDMRGQVTFMNPAAEALLGWNYDDLNGRAIQELIHSESVNDAPGRVRECPLPDVLKSGKSIKVASDDFTRNDGRVLPVSYTLSPIVTDGEIVGAVLAFHDITEQKSAVEQLHESEERYRVVAETATDVIVTMDENSSIIYVNQAVERVFGYTAAEITGKQMTELMPEHLRKAHKAGLSRYLETGKRRISWEVVELPGRHKSGREVPLELSFGEFNKGGKRFFTGIARDVSERKLVEKELVRSEERYRDLVENARDMIYSHDLQGNYISINKAGEQITGYSREEVLNMNFTTSVAPEYLAKAREMVSRKLSGEAETVYELEIIAKDGRQIAVEVNSRLVYRDGVPIGVQGIARDVTERKQLEDQFRLSQKMEAIGKLAGGVAHDFNNLLTVINGYADMTMLRLKEGDPLRKNIKEISKAGDRAAALTRQLLAFSRKQVMKPKVLNLNSVVFDLENMIRRLIGEDVDLLINLALNLNSVKADPGQIEQVTMNLVVNARDAMPCGGKLTIETRNIYLNEDYAKHHLAVTPGPYVMLAISDNGCGMNEETRARIFEPFFTTKEPGKGTGLGLSTVYGIIKQSQGNIWVYSELDYGTTFKVYLPSVTERVDRTVNTQQSRSILPGTETVLLVEDDDIVRAMAREILELGGYKVLEAANGNEALSISRQYQAPIHMMLTDVVMPGMSGRTIADRLEEQRPEMVVLYMSGYTDDAIVHHGVLFEGVNFIEKPFTPEALTQKVRELLDNV